MEHYFTSMILKNDSFMGTSLKFSYLLSAKIKFSQVTL